LESADSQWMIAAGTLPNETQRLAELRSFGILDTLPEAAYDAITYLASQICEAPIALVSLVDEHRQWFKARVGLDATETPRDVAFCAHAILEPSEILVVPDATADERFSANPLVTADPSIRFYAGAPLTTSSGNAMGTLCVIDTESRSLSPPQEKALRALATQVVALFELRLAVDELSQRQVELERVMQQREALIATVSHEIRTPLTAVAGYIELLRDPDSGMPTDERRQMLDLVSRQASDLTHLIEDLLVAARAEAGSLEVTCVDVNPRAQVAQVLEGLDQSRVVEVQVDGEAGSILGDPNRVRQVFRNLLTNAFRYGGPKVRVQLTESDDAVHVLVLDDGPPIPLEDRERMFEAYRQAGGGKKVSGSVGLGLSISRLLTEEMGGSLTYRHEAGNSVFDVELLAARPIAP
jgi:signal transduction histidine kinase